MTDYAVRIKGLGKRFVRSSGSRSFWRQMMRKGETEDHFWALKDINIDVRRGESFGLIGPNGAGKSTLLKIISRILMPTEGEIELYGRINSLLEVGTGFEPDLSGRENVFLNGAILGMSKKEVTSIYDEIVAFSGLRDFMDMPVKQYSSGMYARLAFSVAAYVTGDILAVDEVLSVGDAEFRRKSMGRMNELLSGGGRTIIFVSHSTDAITRFCDRAAWIQAGRIREIGSSDEVVRSYLGATTQRRSLYVVGSEPPPAVDATETPEATPADEERTDTATPEGSVTYLEQRPDLEESESAARVERVALLDRTGRPRDVVFRDEEQVVEVTFSVSKDEAPPISCYCSLVCAARKGVPQDTTVFADFSVARRLPIGRYVARMTIPGGLLTSADYYMTVSLKTIGRPMISHDTLKRVIEFRAVDRDGDPEVGAELLRGVIRPTLRWTVEPDTEIERSGTV